MRVIRQGGPEQVPRSPPLKHTTVCKFESSQKDGSRSQSTDTSKAHRNTSAFKCRGLD